MAKKKAAEIQQQPVQPRDPDSESKLLESVVDACKEEHSELWTNWRHLDSKAQGTITVAGVFLAAAFAFVRTLSVWKMDLGCQIMLVGSLTCLISTVVISVVAIRVRAVTGPPLGQLLQKTVRDLLNVTDEKEMPARYRNHLNDQLNAWSQTIEDVRTQNSRKAKLLNAAHIVLLLAISLVAMMTGLLIFTQE